MNISHLQAPDPNWDKLNSGCQNDKKPCGRIVMLEENKSCISYCRKKEKECKKVVCPWQLCSTFCSILSIVHFCRKLWACYKCITAELHCFSMEMTLTQVIQNLLPFTSTAAWGIRCSSPELKDQSDSLKNLFFL